MYERVFKIGNADLSGNVLADNYSVSKEPVYKSWNDAFGYEHRSKVRDRVEGSFSMFFETLEEYERFANTASTGLLTMTVAVNKPRYELKLIRGYIDFSSTMFRDNAWNPKIKQFKVSIREK